MLITNETASAYAVVAAKNSGFTISEIWMLVNEMIHLMDILSDKEILDKARKLLDGEGY